MIPDNASTPRITAAAGTKLAGAFLRGTVKTKIIYLRIFLPSRQIFTLLEASSITRRCCVRLSPIAQNSLLLPPVESLGRISIPVWLIILSDQLPIIALVGHYPTNKLIGRRPILKYEPKPALTIVSLRIYCIIRY